MALTSEQETVVRSWVGTTVSIDVLNERFERLESLNATVAEELQSQLAELIAQPAQISLPSGLSIQTSQNITALQQLIIKFQNSTDLDSGTYVTIPGIGRMVRREYR